jgi:hypothetical protein
MRSVVFSGVFSVVLVARLAASPLHGANDEVLAALLEKSGERVEAFWEDLSRVKCTERVSRLKLTPEDELLGEQTGVYDYLIVMQLAGNRLRVEESRLEVQESTETHGETGSLLVTTGFATMQLVFHPHFRESFTFSLPEVSTPEEGLVRVRFEAVSGRPTPAALRLRGRDRPIEWSGSAWIDPSSGTVHRIETQLREPMEDLGLRSLQARAEYEEIVLSDRETGMWLPRAASVEVETERQKWRNEHRFSNYELFAVDSTLGLGGSN